MLLIEILILYYIQLQQRDRLRIALAGSAPFEIWAKDTTPAALFAAFARVDLPIPPPINMVWCLSFRFMSLRNIHPPTLICRLRRALPSSHLVYRSSVTRWVIVGTQYYVVNQVCYCVALYLPLIFIFCETISVNTLVQLKQVHSIKSVN